MIGGLRCQALGGYPLREDDTTTITRPITSVRVPGIIMPRPPAMSSSRNRGLIFRYRKPLRAAATPNRPMRALMTICTTWSGLDTFTSSMAGFMAKMYGTMKAAMASLVALMAVFIGGALAMALPA